MVKIKVVDSIPGSGKTSFAINMMNNMSNDSFVFITPYLDEVKRVKTSCNRKFYEPTYYLENKLHKRKFDALQTLLANQKDIVSTHALFKKANRETKELIRNGQYILVLDEVMDVIEQLQIKEDDLETLFAMDLLYRKDGFLLWNEDKVDWDSRYNDIRDMALNHNLIEYKNTVLIWTFPADIFKSFKEVWILTYQFDAQIQKYYYDLNGMEYEYYYAKLNEESNTYEAHKKDDKYSEKEFKKMLKDNITILEDVKLNAIGLDAFALSKSWYMKSGDLVLTQLKKNCENYFKHRVGSRDSNLNMWTTFKDYKSKVKGGGYTKGFVSSNARATNEFRHKKNLAYTINKFPNTIVKGFLTGNGIKVDDNKYALSELLQWIFRSAIRDDQPINIYIPSSRMRALLKNWLDN